MTDRPNDALPEIFQSLADPTRLQVVMRLAGSAAPLTVTEITSCCGVHISGVSRHLGKLRQVGLVTKKKSGREVRYTLNTGELTALLRGMADALERCCDGG